MTTYTDEQLKRALAKMLPDGLVEWKKHYSAYGVERMFLKWCDQSRLVEDTELLHLCSLVEETMTRTQQLLYVQNLTRGQSTFTALCAPWQQRTIAAAKVKGVEIV